MTLFSQGYCLALALTFRKKMCHDIIQMGRIRVNWAKRLPDYARILNKDAREELGWKSPFETYYGRKLNVLRQANDDEVDFEPTVEDIEYEINDRYYEKHE